MMLKLVLTSAADNTEEIVHLVNSLQCFYLTFRAFFCYLRLMVQRLLRSISFVTEEFVLNNNKQHGLSNTGIKEYLIIDLLVFGVFSWTLMGKKNCFSEI